MFPVRYAKLTAISSFRALDASKKVAANQLRAKRSWDDVFDKIILFGAHDSRLATKETEFVDCDDWPAISLLVMAASWQDDPVCILNADIVVSAGLKDILNEGWKKGAMALTSRRYEFDPATEDYDAARVVDPGADFFAALPPAWKEVYKEIPTGFRIGHQLWDSWMLAFLYHRCFRRFFDVTAMRPIFHPKHGDRTMPHHAIDDPESFYLQMGFPPAL